MQGAFPPLPERDAGQGPLKTSGTATLALVTGILAFTCLWGIGGVLAIVIGWLAHGEIERAEGRVTGKGLASAGIALGIANVVVSVVGLGVLVALAVRPEVPSAYAPPAPPPPAVTRIAPPAAPSPPMPAPHEDLAEALPPLPSLPPHVGKIVIVEAVSGGDTLKTQLLKHLGESSLAQERVVLWTVTGGCEPCAAVGRALPDARMQRALAGVRLVRVDAVSLGEDLERLGVPTDSVPGFTLLDAQARPLDHIHGGEWGDDIPANIAPILDKFMRRTLSVRRYQWSRPLRDGETPL